MENIIKSCKDKAYQYGRAASHIEEYPEAIGNIISVFAIAIGEIINNLRTEVAQHGAGIAMQMVSRFAEVREMANIEFEKVLIRTLTYSKKEKAYKNALADLKKRFPDLDEEKIKISPHNTEKDIFWLIGIFLLGLALEGILGAVLLGEVLAGGVLAGLVFAIVMSLINVGGLGIGLGVIFDNFHRKKKIFLRWFILWFLVVLLVNGGVAYSRYEQVAQFEGGAIDPLLAMILFAFLGIFFSSIAFWQSYKKWEPEFLLHK